MSKKMRYFLFVMLLIVPLVLAACGGDDKDDKKDDKGSSVELTQSFESVSGVSFQYPEGWVAGDSDGGPMVANNQAAYDKMAAGGAENNPVAGEAGVVLLAVGLADMGLPEDSDLNTVYGMMVGAMTGEGMETVGEPADIKVGGADAKKVYVKDAESGNEGMLVVSVKDGNLFMGVLANAAGETSNFEAAALAIIGSATYTAPAG
jgi:hypothetical protein